MRKMSALGSIAAIALLATGCTAAEAAPSVERWWDNGRASTGSEIAPGDADKIEPNEDLYCGMLRATIDAGESIFPADIDPSDDEYLATTTAFFAEVQALSPRDLQESWGDMWSLVDTLIQASDDITKLEAVSIDPVAVQAASEAITEHATTTCGLSL